MFSAAPPCLLQKRLGLYMQHVQPIVLHVLKSCMALSKLASRKAMVVFAFPPSMSNFFGAKTAVLVLILVYVVANRSLQSCGAGLWLPTSSVSSLSG